MKDTIKISETCNYLEKVINKLFHILERNHLRKWENLNKRGVEVNIFNSDSIKYFPGVSYKRQARNIFWDYSYIPVYINYICIKLIKKFVYNNNNYSNIEINSLLNKIESFINDYIYLISIKMQDIDLKLTNSQEPKLTRKIQKRFFNYAKQITKDTVKSYKKYKIYSFLSWVIKHPLLSVISFMSLIILPVVKATDIIS